MSIMLSATGIAGVTRETVEKCLDEYTLQRGGLFKPVQNATMDQANILMIAEAPENKITILYPPSLSEWKEVSQHLSRNINAPVFAFHIHEGTLWMYLFYLLGDEIGRFSTMPDYFTDHLTQEARAKWDGDAAVICQHWPGMTEEWLSKYLVHWGIGSFGKAKAYPDDVFDMGDCWQVLDFMSRLGLRYPLDEFGKIHGHAYQFITERAFVPEPDANERHAPASVKKSWWQRFSKD